MSPEPSLSYAAIGLDYRGISHGALSSSLPLSLSLFLHTFMFTFNTSSPEFLCFLVSQVLMDPGGASMVLLDCHC